MSVPEPRGKGTLPPRVAPCVPAPGSLGVLPGDHLGALPPVPSARILPYASPSFTLSLEVALAVDALVLEEQRRHQADDPPASPRPRSLSRPERPWCHPGSTALSDPLGFRSGCSGLVSSARLCSSPRALACVSLAWAPVSHHLRALCSHRLGDVYKVRTLAPC